ncbi:argininosuccinate lyase [Candidatus Hydrogenisulfobacillus filiaventi]|uniref:Argininosuccinate lyase n=1 Tax=Candidatus Hydrogenisulfobacillus filiaventi TaxID=2707344 RepID=A0A6F8ZJ43_9FIRM|nr:argininosuccinate lyase [Candidatus Hydrogenisulfobacillus filiaventi]
MSSRSEARNPLFRGGPAPEAQAFTASVRFDWRLLPFDIQGSRAHVAMLAARGILDPDTARRLDEGLAQVLAEAESGRFTPRLEWEDVHMNVEGRLAEILGPVAGTLHTARSRNDQVQVDMLLYMRHVYGRMQERLAGLAGALLQQARAHLDVIIPGYTHMQAAQPVLLAHHWLAYTEMLRRDLGRLDDWARRMNRSPLGAGALAGTPYPTDPEDTARRLGFDGIYRNSLDAVSDRDYLVEFLAWAAITAMHLSRLGEELVLWSSVEFGYIRVDDAYSTGSSIMPQKRNPDVAELVRGKAGRVYGNLLGLLTTLKGLPLAYNSDLQEDKEAVFEVVDTMDQVLEVLAGMVRTLTVDRARIRARLGRDFTAATDLADRLAAAGMPFREAHHLVGALVGRLLEEGKGFGDVTPAWLAAFLEDAGRPGAIDPAWLAELTPERLVAARRQPFATAPERVAERLAEAERFWQGVGPAGGGAARG